MPGPAYEIAVVGAGPAGLMAALRAARAGHRVALFERSEGPGGMAASFEVGGVRVDFGSHRLHPSIDPGLLAELHSVVRGGLQVRPRQGRIRLADRWLAFPLRTTDLIRALPPSFSARAALDVLASPFRRPREDTFAEVVRAGLGPTVASQFYEPYVRKLWGTAPSDLSGELARRRVSARSPLAVARRLRRRGAQERAFLYPSRGFGAIAEGLAEAASEAGVDMRYGTPVERVGLDQPGVSVEIAGGETVVAARVWSTAPLPALLPKLTPEPPADVLRAATGLRHRGLVLVYLVLECEQYTPFDAHYFPGLDVCFSRVSEPKNYRQGPDPTDRTVLCAEVPCTEGDGVWSSSDDVLAHRVKAELVGQGLPDPQSVAAEVRRLPRVYPLYRPGFEADLAGVERWVGEQHRLLTFGRQGLFVPDNTHHALAMGAAAAAALGPDGSFDEGGWARARDGFRSHVVED